MNKFKLFIIMQFICLLIILSIGGWWSFLLLDKSKRIAELEKYPYKSIELEKTRKMLFWESMTFFIILFGAGGVLVYLVVRESKRNSTLECFFSSIAHELKTPLTGIRLQAETIEEISEKGSNVKTLSKRLLSECSSVG